MLGFIRHAAQLLSGAIEVPLTPERMARDLVAEATRTLGMGERGGNNRGLDVERFRTNQYTGKRFGGWGAWCAAWASYVIERCSLRWAPEKPIVRRNHSAKWLWRSIRSVGHEVSRPVVGAFALYRRKGGYHIALVVKVEPSTGRYWTVDGNKGRFPPGAKVDRFKHAPNEPNLIGFAVLWREQ